MLVHEPVFHLGCFEKMANAFFSISLSSLRLAFSFCNFLNSSSLGFRCPFPGKLPAGSSVYFRLHVRNRFSCIPRLRAASVTFRPPSVISLTASSLNCLSYFLFLLFSFCFSLYGELPSHPLYKIQLQYVLLFFPHKTFSF